MEEKLPNVILGTKQIDIPSTPRWTGTDGGITVTNTGGQIPAGTKGGYWKNLTWNLGNANSIYNNSSITPLSLSVSFAIKY